MQFYSLTHLPWYSLFFSFNILYLNDDQFVGTSFLVGEMAYKLFPFTSIF